MEKSVFVQTRGVSEVDSAKNKPFFGLKEKNLEDLQSISLALDAPFEFKKKMLG